MAFWIPIVAERSEAPPGGSFLGSVKAVAWSFFGVRRQQDHESDVSNLNPLHVVIAAVGMAVVFVLTLIVIVRFVVG